MIPAVLACLVCLVVGPPAGVSVRTDDGKVRSDFKGGVPAGSATDEIIGLSLEDAVARGMQQNLGVLLAREGEGEALGRHLQSRSARLPQLSAAVDQSSRQLNLNVIGFSNFPNIPDVVGPFDVFDARLFLSWRLYDPAGSRKARSDALALDGARWSRRDAEDFLRLLVTDSYLRALTWKGQVEAVRTHLRTAQSLRDLAVSRNESGLAAGIEVLRAEVRVSNERQRVIVAENNLAKQRLTLAQVIGLPLGQEFELVDSLGGADAPVGTVEEALAIAYAQRSDLRAAEALAESARLDVRAERGERLPAVVLGADYGALGNDLGSAVETFNVGAAIRVPIFDGGRIRGETLEAEASAVASEARLEDLRATIYYQVHTIHLDLEASREQVSVARGAVELARQQLVQARNRFAAGVASNLEVVEAQDSVAVANEDWLFSMYRYDLDRARLRRATGSAGSPRPSP